MRMRPITLAPPFVTTKARTLGRRRKPAYYLGGRSRGPVQHDIAVESRPQLLARWVTVDLIDGRSGVQKRRVPILEPVAGVADIAAHLELDMSVNGSEIALLKNTGRIWSCQVLGRADLDEIDPINLCIARRTRAWQLTCAPEKERNQDDSDSSSHSLSTNVRRAKRVTCARTLPSGRAAESARTEEQHRTANRTLKQIDS